MTSEFDANRAQNLPEIEKQMAVKCVEHAQTYWNLLEKLDARSLRLTKLDDDIYAHMLEAFPELAEGAAGDAAVGKIDEEEMKSESGKTRWREFIARYEGKGEQRSARAVVKWWQGGAWRGVQMRCMRLLGAVAAEVAGCAGDHRRDEICGEANRVGL